MLISFKSVNSNAHYIRSNVVNKFPHPQFFSKFVTFQTSAFLFKSFITHSNNSYSYLNNRNNSAFFLFYLYCNNFLTYTNSKLYLNYQQSITKQPHISIYFRNPFAENFMPQTSNQNQFTKSLFSHKFANKYLFKKLFANKLLFLFLNRQLFSIFINKNRKKSTTYGNFFLISNFDIISQEFLRLTKSTKFLNPSDFFLDRKNRNSKSVAFFKLGSFTLNINNCDYFFQSAFFNNTRLIKNTNTRKIFLKSPIKSYMQRSNIFIENRTTYLKQPSACMNHRYCNHWDYDHFFNNNSSIVNFFFKPLFLKYFTFLTYSSKSLSRFNLLMNSTNFHNSSSFFYNRHTSSKLTNLIPNDNFQYFLKKTVMKIFDFDKFSSLTTPWHYQTLIKFLEFCSGKKVAVNLNGFLNNSLTFDERTRCLLWAQRVKYFRKVLGPRLFLNESIQIMYLALKNKDPYLLSNWIVTTMYKISFWKYKTFLRYIKYVLRYFFWAVFKELNVKGVKFQLKGKISVAGNARKRTAFHYIGFTSHATFDNKILYNLSLVRSFTGVMGLKLWITF